MSSTEPRWRSRDEDIAAATAGRTIPTLVAGNVATRGSETALRWHTGSHWSRWTWRGYAERASRVAALLRARGIGRGDSVALMMGNRPEFHAADLGALLVGATPFSVYNTSSPEQIRYLFSHASAGIAIVESRFAENVRAIRDELPALHDLIVLGDSAGTDDEPADFHTLTAAAEPVDFPAAAAATDPDDLATLVYTSGTTGPPKAVALTHRNICWMVESLAVALDRPEAGTRMISYLPMAHMLERMLTYYLAGRLGAEVTCCPDPAATAAYLTQVRPQLFVAPPRIWEKLRSSLDAEAITGEAAAAAIGLDACRAALIGSAPTPHGLVEYFRELGVPLTEAYGLSETSGLLTVETRAPRSGTVGRAAPGCEIRTLPDGEICARGGNVFSGYLGDPQRTAETLDADGWLRTGDIGTIDQDGYLRIIDRKKELIVTGSGKNISPANIEAVLKQIPLVGQACVIGESRPYLTALLVLDGTACAAWAQHNGTPDATAEDLAAHPAVRSTVAAGVAEVNSRLSRPEQVKKFHLIGTEWLPGSQCLTPKMSLKRRGVHERYKSEIEALYSDTQGDPVPPASE